MATLEPVISPVREPVVIGLGGVIVKPQTIEDWILEDGTWDDTKYWRDGAEWKDS